VLVFGGGSAAMAGFGVQTPWGWVAEQVFQVPQDNGARCFQGMRVEYAATLADDAPIVLDAQDIVAAIDVESLDTRAQEAHIREVFQGEAAKSDADVKQMAVFDVVGQLMVTGLDARGYSEADLTQVWLQGQRDECAK